MYLMENNDQVRVSRGKEATSPLGGSECQTLESNSDPSGALGTLGTFGDIGALPGNGIVFEKIYPSALVLRLRVLQIVSGISAMVMGTVGLIEEHLELNLGLALPAGGATVIAAAVSIHTSRGFEGHRPVSSGPKAFLGCISPSIRQATPLALLWGVASILHVALLVQASKTMANTDISSKNILVLAAVEMCLSLLTLIAMIVVLRIDCVYDPD